MTVVQLLTDLKEKTDALNFEIDYTKKSSD